MSTSINEIKKSRGRPAVGVGTPVMVRLRPEEEQAIDAWIADQKGRVTRPQAIRELIRLGLAADHKDRVHR